MFAQVITFSLNGITEEDYLDAANRLASRVADRPGLLAKVWFENEEANRYGGIYFWEDQESMDRFSQSDLFEGAVVEFGNVIIEEFKVLENLTRSTQPVLQILEQAEARPAPALAAQAAESPAATAGPPATRKKTPPPRSAPASTSARKPSTKPSTAKKAGPSKPASRKTASRRTA